VCVCECVWKFSSADQNEQHKTGARAGELSISRYKSSKNGALSYLH
jgi:hypothetical protein